MKNKYVPYAVAKSIYEIDVNFYKEKNVKILLMDLDNTLDSYKLYHPTERAVELIKKIQDAGILPVIVSNNRGKRVRTYANDLHLEYINSAAKPFGFKIKKFIKAKGWNTDEMMFVGDQMITDVAAAKRAGLRVILTDKIVKEDQWTTHINRIFGRRIRKYHAKRGNLIDWRKLYGQS
jgi:HAD superfamily phosphatase (TIGR01668 family)